jgi:ABC-type bacteriocin/lantibiotic exporter with double-glycine peptidase domain
MSSDSGRENRAKQEIGEVSQVSRDEPRTRAFKSVTFVPQLTPTDCGAASLASVLAYHGKHVPIHEVRSMLGGGRNGVTAKQLLAAARRFGLSARGVAIEPGTLRYLPQGSILHWDLAHFVVYEASNAKFVHIVDPGMGRRRVPVEDAAKSLSGVALVFEPGQDFVREAPKRRVRYKRYTGWMFSARNVWGRILWTSFFLQLLALSTPGLMAILVDKVVPRGDTQLLYLVGSGFLILASFTFLSTLLRSRLLLELRTKVEARMSFDFVEHLFALPYAFFQQRTTGDLMMRLSSQVAIRELLTSGALSALLDGALVSVYFVLLLGAAPSLAVVALAIAALQVAIYMFAARRSARLMVEGLAAQSQLEAYQVEMLSGIETLKSMGATDRSFSRWSDLYVNSLNRTIARDTLEGSFGSVLGALRFCGPVCLMLVGAYKVLDGSLSLGSMLGLAALGAGFLEPVASLVGTAMKLTHLRGYMERIEDVLETPREIQRTPTQQERAAVLHLAGAIQVDELSFKYPSESQNTLQRVSFLVHPGECLAIVGPSGSGKSTLARLLAGLYEPESGSVSFDGRELRSWDLLALRERLGIVTQDTRLFSGTIRDNVALFEPNVPLDEVEEACRLACLDEAVTAMPMGYDTMLADGGSSISGGQRQRLSLARALVRRPSVLILDEATSALDAVTERNVQDNLRELRCTQVIVAHRLSTVVEADKILVLEQGKVVGMGRHEELLQHCATYRDLVRSQSEAGSTEREAKRKAVVHQLRQPTATLVTMPEARAAQRTIVGLPVEAKRGRDLLPSTTLAPSRTLAPSTTMTPNTTLAPSTTMASNTTLAPVAPRAPAMPSAPAPVVPRAPTAPYATPAASSAVAPNAAAPAGANTAAADDGTRVKWGKQSGV